MSSRSSSLPSSRRSPSSSRSRSPSSRTPTPRSSRSRSPSPASSISSHHSSADRRASSTSRSSDADLPTDAELLYSCVEKGDIDGLKRLLDWNGAEEERPSDESQAESLLTSPLHPNQEEVASMSGENAVFFAAYYNQSVILAYFALFRCVKERLFRPVLLKMLSFQRYKIVFSICEHHKPFLTEALTDKQETLLHLACQRRKTPGGFIDDLMKRVKKSGKAIASTFVNAQDTNGDTALHILAARSYGKEGGTVAKKLILFGADETEENYEGKNPRAVSVNPFVRDVLSLGHGPKPRPLPQIDEHSKSEIDKCKDSDHFPPIKPIEVPPTDPFLLLPPSSYDAAPEGGATGKQQKKKKKLGAEELEALSTRLSVQSVQLKDKWLQTKLSAIEDRDRSRSKIRSAEEVDETVQRLYDDELANRESKKEELQEKYIKPQPGAPTIDFSTMEESAVRLGGKPAVAHRKEVRQQLELKYSPARDSRRLSKDAVRASAARLHDESTTHVKETHAELFAQYCARPVSPKLSRSQQGAMADRLSKAA